MAKTGNDALGPAGATMFLSPMSAPGIVIERVLDTLDGFMAGGHAVIRLDGLRVPEMRCLGGSARVSLCSGTARACTADALHALAWCRPARPRHCHGLRAAALCLWQAYWRARRGRALLADNEMDITRAVW